MGLLRWMRGGDDNSATSSALGAGLAEIDALFRPSRHKQTEHIQEARRKRHDAAQGNGVDLDRGIVVIRPNATPPRAVIAEAADGGTDASAPDTIATEVAAGGGMKAATGGEAGTAHGTAGGSGSRGRIRNPATIATVETDPDGDPRR